MIRENLILEIDTWGFDENLDRPVFTEVVERAQAHVEEVLASLPEWNSRAAVVEDVPEEVQKALTQIAERSDLQVELQGLDWTLGVVDLRRLVSFQRRLVLRHEITEKKQFVDWPKRIEVALPPSRRSSFTHRSHGTGLTLTSENPDLTVRLHALSEDAETFGLKVHHGSPFMEVGCYRGRWFLRDGYHRAYRLMRAGVFEVPAVIVHARTLEELGANQPYFFPEEVLFSHRPPLVTDFLSVDFVVRWRRPPRRKVIRIEIREEFELSGPEDGQGAEYEHCNQAR
ncbi:MAG TPA: hypothetical protein VM554_05555 [Acidisarcina sp.]|nr:hypothetical protein [Acidisarcina sp.]